MCFGRLTDKSIESLGQKAGVGVMPKSSALKNEARLLYQPAGFKLGWSFPVE